MFLSTLSCTLNTHPHTWKSHMVLLECGAPPHGPHLVPPVWGLLSLGSSYRSRGKESILHLEAEFLLPQETGFAL